MRMIALARRASRAARLEDGFTMIIALGVMLVTALLLAAAFTAANGDVDVSHRDLSQKQAYFAALAGVQAYEHELQINPNFWETCKALKTSLPQEASSSYEVTVLKASQSASACSTSNPFETVIENSGTQANTFRVESTGSAGKSKRSLVATFGVNGFLNYIYFTRYETQDPAAYGGASFCKNYRPARQAAEASSSQNCTLIQFAGEDNVNGPMHTDDAADLCGSVEFGRKGHVPADTVEINGAPYAENCGSEGSKPVYNTPTKSWTRGPELVPPEEDTSLSAYVEPGFEFEGATTIELEGKEATITNANYNSGKPKKIKLPPNGLIWVHSMEKTVCKYVYKQNNGTADTSTARNEELPCGTIYVKGKYSESLTLAAEKDVVIKGSVWPESIGSLPASGSTPKTPSGTVTLGLIATNYVRVYHPCSGFSEEGIKNPWIFAAILSTSHSFLVDNDECGKPLGELNIFGAVAQNFRGIVATGGGSGTGYVKNYNYDDRLATDEPPYFLAPLKAGWKIERQTASTGG
jgi:Tfp pilus assembly protein PilX